MGWLLVMPYFTHLIHEENIFPFICRVLAPPVRHLRRPMVQCAGHVRVQSPEFFFTLNSGPVGQTRQEFQ